MRKLVLFSSLLLLGACGTKEEATPEAKFEGYTGRDANRTLVGPTDPTDWTADAAPWNSSETGLFTQYNASFSKPQLPADVWHPYPVFPNPVAVGGKNQFSILADKTNPAYPPTKWVRLAYAVVDTRYNVLSWGETNGIDQNFGSIVSYPAGKYSGNTLYRMYYILYDEVTRQVYYKGHGDIQVMP
jgi:hypothetical protein